MSRLARSHGRVFIDPNILTHRLHDRQEYRYSRSVRIRFGGTLGHSTAALLMLLTRLHPLWMLLGGGILVALDLL
jgi:hypothetical protein